MYMFAVLTPAFLAAYFLVKFVFMYVLDAALRYSVAVPWCVSPKPLLYSLYFVQTTTCPLVNFVQSCSNTWAVGERPALLLSPRLLLLQLLSCHIRMAVMLWKHLSATRTMSSICLRVPACLHLSRTSLSPFSANVFSSPRFQFHSQHSRLVEHFGSFWSTFQHWMPRLWCTLKIQESRDTLKTWCWWAILDFYYPEKQLCVSVCLSI